MNSNKSVGERPAEGERLSKRVMQLRRCSRRDAEQYIEAGFVCVDGVVVQEPSRRVNTQKVTVDAHASLLKLMSVTLIMNKPVGLTDGIEPLTTARESKGPRNVRSLLTLEQHSKYDDSGVRFLKNHLTKS